MQATKILNYHDCKPSQSRHFEIRSIKTKKKLNEDIKLAKSPPKDREVNIHLDTRCQNKGEYFHESQFNRGTFFMNIIVD